MRRTIVFLAIVGASWALAPAQTPVWVTPDVPTDEMLSGNQMLAVGII